MYYIHALLKARRSTCFFRDLEANELFMISFFPDLVDLDENILSDAFYFKLFCFILHMDQFRHLIISCAIGLRLGNYRIGLNVSCNVLFIVNRLKVLTDIIGPTNYIVSNEKVLSWFCVVIFNRKITVHGNFGWSAAASHKKKITVSKLNWSLNSIISTWEIKVYTELFVDCLRDHNWDRKTWISNIWHMILFWHCHFTDVNVLRPSSKYYYKRYKQ